MVVSITFATVRMSRLKHVQLFAFRAHDLKKMVKNEYFENLPKICVFLHHAEQHMKSKRGLTQNRKQHGSQNAGSLRAHSKTDPTRKSKRGLDLNLVRAAGSQNAGTISNPRKAPSGLAAGSRRAEIQKK